MKNLIFESKSYDRKGKVCESIEYHNKHISAKAKEEKLFGEEISKLFFANNEIFFHYLLDKYNIDWFNLPKEWHTYLMTKDKITKDLKSVKMIHLINKRFEELWQVLDV